MCKRDYLWNSTRCICINGKYSASIISNSVITCDEIIETTETIPAKTNF